MADSELQSVWECFGILAFVCPLEISVYTYKKEVLRLVTTHILKLTCVAWLLVFEAKLASMVSR